MFGFLGRLFRGRHPTVFRFRSGGRWHYRDVTDLYQRLKEQNADWLELSEAVATAFPATDETADQARRQFAELAGVVSRAFRVPLLWDNGEGMTQAELIELLAKYMDFCTKTLDRKPRTCRG